MIFKYYIGARLFSNPHKSYFSKEFKLARSKFFNDLTFNKPFITFSGASVFSTFKIISEDFSKRSLRGTNDI